MDFVKSVDKSLRKAIEYIIVNKEQYVKNPQRDFSRTRKLSMKDIINQIISMGGGTLKQELYDLSKVKKTNLTPSAFVQQRSKISSTAFKDIFTCFNANCKDVKAYRGYRLLGIDGSDINCPRNPESEYFFSSAQNPEGINQIHLNALYDICNKVYVDVEFQLRTQWDERQALINMLGRNDFGERTLIIADRGYESFNMFAHFTNKDNMDFLCRAKHGTGAIKEIRLLPMQELDTDITIEITTTQTKEDKLRGRRFIQTGRKKGKKYSPKTVISRWDFPSPYLLKLRAVRILLDNGDYETLVTSLNREEFPPEEIKKLYHMRWDIETSFRDLKYSIGLTRLHSKKDDLIRQEIYAAIIMYNYCSRISGSVAIQKRQLCKHTYRVNFVMAVYLCKKFYRSIKKDFESLIYDISNYTEPIRPGRRDKRNLRTKRFIGFIYRAA